MKKVELAIKTFLEERGWDNLRPSDLAKSISIEAAELLEHFQWSSQELQEVKKDKIRLESIEKELADVLIYALQASVLLGIDTEKIIMDKLEHASKKYPAKLMKERRHNKEPGTEDTYLKIKQEYRKKGL